MRALRVSLAVSYDECFGQDNLEVPSGTSPTFQSVVEGSKLKYTLTLFSINLNHPVRKYEARLEDHDSDSLEDPFLAAQH